MQDLLNKLTTRSTLFMLFSTSALWRTIHPNACWTLMMYESVTPVCEGEMLNRVPTVKMATTKVSKIPRKSRRIPSQRYILIHERGLLMIPNDKTHLIRNREPIRPVLDVDSLLVVLQESLLLSVRADGSQSRQRFREMTVQGGTQDGVYTIHQHMHRLMVINPVPSRLSSLALAR